MLHRAYYRRMSAIPSETLKLAFERASRIPLELPWEDSVEQEADIIGRIWRLGLTLVLVMASGEKLMETGRLLKVAKSKNRSFGGTGARTSSEIMHYPTALFRSGRFSTISPHTKFWRDAYSRAMDRRISTLRALAPLRQRARTTRAVRIRNKFSRSF
jgi:hypothetical protein